MWPFKSKGDIEEQEYIPAKREYKVRDLWWKLSLYAKTAGKEVVEKCLWLHYAAQRRETPSWAKSVIYGAIAYFILPVDAIPDFIPVSGYSDDLLALAAAVGTVSVYINEEVKEKTRNKMRTWFGDTTNSDN